MASAAEVFERQVSLSKVQQDVQNLRDQLSSELEERISRATEEFITKVESDVNLNPAFKSHKVSNGFRPKMYQTRESFLTAMFRVSHVHTIYNLAVAVLLIQFINTIFEDLLEHGRILLSFRMLRFAFGRVDVVVASLITMNFTVLASYYAFKFWAFQRISSKGHSDRLWLFLYIATQLIWLVIPAAIVIHFASPPASTMIILAEQIRFMMKMHAFVRECAPRIQQFNQESKEKSAPPIPTFKNYVYFLFVPCLVYRSEYPRTKKIRWSFVLMNFTEVVLCVFYMYFMLDRFAIPMYQDFGKRPFSKSEIMATVFSSMIPGTMILFCGFYSILHSWMNAWAEITRFGDRLFYRDWWNSSNYSNYYRTWNIIVHDWIFSYIYRDIHNLKQLDRRLAQFVCFLVSAIIHEYIVVLAFGYFYPVLLVEFLGFGVLFLYMTGNRQGHLWNMVFWILMFTGHGLLMSAYLIEAYARINCPRTIESFADYFVPRSWFCDISSK